MTTKTETVQKIISVKALAELNEFGLGSRKATLMQESAGTHLVRAAIIGKGAFKATVESWYESIRKDVNGIAVRLGAERNKDGTGYVVPGSLRVQVSQVLRAMEFDVDLGTESKPRGMGEIRAATSEAAEAAEAAKPAPVLSPEDASKAAALKALADASAEIAKATGAKLAALVEATTVYSAAVLGILAKSETPAETAKPAETAQPMPEARKEVRAAAKPRKARKAA